MKSYTYEEQMECPHCHSDEHIVKLWEDKESYEKDIQPDFIGCKECHVMHEVVHPTANGCWICYTDADLPMLFDIDFDSFVHEECLEAHDCDTVLEYEQS